jgi:hypothetical protein
MLLFLGGASSDAEDRIYFSLTRTFGSVRCARRLVALAFCAGLSACVEKGDFGRPKQSVWNDVVLNRVGSKAARLRGEPVSGFPLTDAEDELRDRSWRFLMPAHERSKFDSLIANLVRTRILPPNIDTADQGAYYRTLMGVRARSPASRFRRIGEDAAADAALIAPFAEVALKVIAADDARMKGLTFVEEVSDREIAHAVARVAENRCLVAWVREELAERTASYSYAVQHAFVAMPQDEAIATERAVRDLDRHRSVLAGLPVPPWRDGGCLRPAMIREGKRAIIVKG